MSRPFERFRLPQWRWSRVLEMCQTYPPARALPSDDEFIRQAKQFWILYRVDHLNPVARLRLANQHPDLLAAVELGVFADAPWDATKDVACDMIRAQILAAQSVKEIEMSTGLSPETIRWYERLFFDVRDRLEYPVWVMSHVLLPAADRENLRRKYRSYQSSAVCSGFVLQMLAYYAGKQVFDTMLGPARMKGSRQTLPMFLATLVNQKAVRGVMTGSVSRYNIDAILGAAIKLQEIALKKDEEGRSEAQVLSVTRLILSELGSGTRVVRDIKALPPLQHAVELTGDAGPSLEPRDAELYEAANVRGES